MKRSGDDAARYSEARARSLARSKPLWPFPEPKSRFANVTLLGSIVGQAARVDYGLLRKHLLH